MKILITGSTGYVGKRLLNELLARGHEVWAHVRLKVFQEKETDQLHYIYGDFAYPETIEKWPSNIDAAYYLMHSMGSFNADLIEQEKLVASHFVKVLKGVEQIIYLTGIIDEKHLSPHLASRLAVEEILKNSGYPTTILRASIIVGSGSASFEIIRDLTEKLPIMVAPRWIESKCQPIAIKDVLFYLTEVLGNPNCLFKIFDIGGPEILTFKELLLNYAEVRGLQRRIFTVPVLTPRLSSYWLMFITSVRFSLASSLVESMKSDTCCRDKGIHLLFPHDCLPYKKAIALALQEIAQNAVTSTWMDAWDIQSPFIQQYIEVPSEGVLTDIQTLPIKGPIEDVQKNIWQLGGKRGGILLSGPGKHAGLSTSLQEASVLTGAGATL